MVSPNANVENFSTPELLTRTFLAVNQLIIYHAVSIWYTEVQKMHQGEPGFELNLSVDDVTTSVQHGTTDLAEATRERDVTHRQPEF